MAPWTVCSATDGPGGQQLGGTIIGDRNRVTEDVSVVDLVRHCLGVSAPKTPSWLIVEVVFSPSRLTR